jgi:tRNA(Arg) A34 adenosine deaminase TadA
MYLKLAMATTVALVTLTACTQSIKTETTSMTASSQCTTPPPSPYTPNAVTEEQDAIYTLLAYAVVYKDWQTSSWDEPDKSRGYNIGSILVNPASPPGKQVVCWARNSVIKTDNGTQHGEVRLLTNYIQNSQSSKVQKYKLYTSLEPCAMCSGMMTLQSLATTIYGQTDPRYGKAIERLVLNSTALSDGYCPYPRGVQSVASPLYIRKQIDAAYQKVENNMGITDWLITPDAKALYEQAVDQLNNFQVQHSENQAVLTEAKEFINQVPAQYTAIPYTTACPPANES